MRHSRRITPVVLALSLALAACNVSSDDDSAATTAAANTTTPVSDTAGSTTTPPEPARGVTADTIKIGGAMIDIDGLKTQFGIDLGTYNPDIIPAIVAWINEEGINGRTIEYVERQFLPIGTDSSQQACRELVEDEQVFAVAGVFLDANPLCVTETYSTAYFGGFGLTPEFQERSKAPFIITGNDYAEELRASTQLLIDENTLDGAKVALFYDSDAIKTIADEIVTPLLEAAGISVVSAAQLSDTGGDQVAAAAAMAQILQKFESDGADTLIDLTGINNLLPALEQTDYAPKIVIINGQILGERAAENFGLTYPAELKGAIAVTSGLTNSESIEDPVVQECIAGINAHTDLAITSTDLLPTKENPASRGFTTVPVVCGIFDLLRTVLIAAGPNPTNESIVAGLDSLESFRVAGNPSGSLSSTRWGAGGVVRIFTFDEASVTFLPEND